MTDAIDELERLLEAANQSQDEVWTVSPNGDTTDLVRWPGRYTMAMNKPRANFIAEAHNHLPALLAYVRALEAVAEQAEHFARTVDGYDMQRDALTNTKDALDAARARLNGGK